MSYVLGLDLSLTSTGRAILNEPFGDPITDRTLIAIDTITSATAGDDYSARRRRITGLAERIVVDETGPTLVVVEGPSYGSSAQKSASIHDRAGLWWAVVGTLLDAGTPVAVVAPTTRAKWATGRGNAGKTEVATAVARLWPQVDARTDDEWDALALATMGAQHLGWDVPSRAHQALTLAAVTWPETRVPATPQTVPTGD